MKKFAFSLEKVLTYKEQIEANLRAEYAQIMQKVAREEEKLRGLEEEYSDCSFKYEEKKKTGSTIRQLKVFENYLQSVLSSIEMTKRAIERLKLEEERKRQELIEAKTETSSIDKIKEKRKKEYAVAVKKEEENLIEEFVANTSSGKVKTG